MGHSASKSLLAGQAGQIVMRDGWERPLVAAAAFAAPETGGPSAGFPTLPRDVFAVVGWMLAPSWAITTSFAGIPIEPGMTGMVEAVAIQLTLIPPRRLTVSAADYLPASVITAVLTVGGGRDGAAAAREVDILGSSELSNSCIMAALRLVAQNASDVELRTSTDPVPDAAALLNHVCGPSLRRLTVDSSSTGGRNKEADSESDMAALGAAIYAHPDLQRVTFPAVHASDDLVRVVERSIANGNSPTSWRN
jgi:hypothetical protein